MTHKTLTDPDGDTLELQPDRGSIYVHAREGETADWSVIGPFTPADLHAAIDEVTGETHTDATLTAQASHEHDQRIIQEWRDEAEKMKDRAEKAERELSERDEVTTASVIHDGGAYWKGEYERVVQERDEAVDRAKKAGREALFWKDHAEEVGDSAAYMKQMWKKAERERDEARAEAEGAPMTARESVDGLTITIRCEANQ